MYISRLCYDVSVCPSVCDGSALWSRCMPGRGEGSSRAMLATARPSCFLLAGMHLCSSRAMDAQQTVNDMGDNGDDDGVTWR